MRKKDLNRLKIKYRNEEKQSCKWRRRRNWSIASQNWQHRVLTCMLEQGTCTNILEQAPISQDKFSLRSLPCQAYLTSSTRSSSTVTQLKRSTRNTSTSMISSSAGGCSSKSQQSTLPTSHAADNQQVTNSRLLTIKHPSARSVPSKVILRSRPCFYTRAFREAAWRKRSQLPWITRTRKKWRTRLRDHRRMTK